MAEPGLITTQEESTFRDVLLSATSPNASQLPAQPRWPRHCDTLGLRHRHYLGIVPAHPFLGKLK